MDFNDINERIRRMYSALNEQNEYDIEEHTQLISQKDGNMIKTEVRFGKSNEIDLKNKVFSAISSIASLKDHLARKVKNVDLDPQIVEDMINKNDSLCLIMDLWNQDKHGYPLTKYRRSQKDPKIIGFKQVLSMGFQEGQGNSAFFMLDRNGNIRQQGNNKIIIYGEVVDGNGIYIMSLDEMFTNALKEVEAFIDDYKLCV